MKEICRIVTANHRVPLSSVEFALRWGEEKFKRWHKFDKLSQCKEFMRSMEYPDDNTLIKFKDGKHTIPVRFGSAEAMQRYFDEFKPTSMNVVPSAAIVFDFDVDERTERSCACRGTRSCCDDCWVAIIRPVMQKLLRFCAFMGFKEYQAFFSGRRGFNIWVLDAPKADKIAKTNLFTRLQKEWNITVDRSVLVTNNHLVKAPYMPHQTTGFLALPIDDLFVPSKSKQII